MATLRKKSEKTAVQELDVSEIRPGSFQPRIMFDEEALQELASSIKEEGLIQPITVRPIEDDDDPDCKYEIIAGERRWRAFKMLKKGSIPAIIKIMDDRQTAVSSLIENIQRSSLTVLEEARGYKRLMSDLKMKQQEVADKVGKPRATIAQIIRLLNLHKDVLYMMETKQLEAGQTRPLLALPEEQQKEVAEVILKKGLNSLQTQNLVKKLVLKMENTDEDDEDDTKSKKNAEQEAEESKEREKELQESIRECFDEEAEIKIKVQLLGKGGGRVTFTVDEESWDEFIEKLQSIG
jgi:ParB family transcriptional regulator, chromosome partitioning protein